MNTDETTAWLLLDTPRCSCLGNPPMYLRRCSNGCMEKKKKEGPVSTRGVGFCALTRSIFCSHGSFTYIVNSLCL